MTTMNDKNGTTLKEGDRVCDVLVGARGYILRIVECPHDIRQHGKLQAIIRWEGGQIGGGWTSIDLLYCPRAAVQA